MFSINTGKMAFSISMVVIVSTHQYVKADCSVEPPIYGASIEKIEFQGFQPISIQVKGYS